MEDKMRFAVSGEGKRSNMTDVVAAGTILGTMNSMPYSSDALSKLFRNIDKKNKIFKDCPCCGTKRVNIYYKDGMWKCRLCWEEEQCNNCSHKSFETVADVASCNCCEHGSFFSEIKKNE